MRPTSRSEGSALPTPDDRHPVTALTTLRGQDLAMICARAPSDMTAAERWREVSELLGLGCLRLLLSQVEPEKRVALSAESEAPYPQLVDTSESQTGKERAT